VADFLSQDGKIMVERKTDPRGCGVFTKESIPWLEVFSNIQNRAGIFAYHQSTSYPGSTEARMGGGKKPLFRRHRKPMAIAAVRSRRDVD